MKSKNKGISLIVLVITIVVMVILATAIILSLRTTKIMNNANKAQQDSDFANAKEVITIAKAEWDLEEKQLRSEGYGSFTEYAEKRLKSAGFKIGNDAGEMEIKEDGTLLIYKTPVVPDGFVASDIATEDEISEGFVIYKGSARVSTDADAKTTRDQFVWVPVPDVEALKLKNYVGTANFTKFAEISTVPYAEEKSDYDAMYESVKKYGGFYVARYEAGTSAQRISSTTGTHKVMSRKGAYVYNYVGVSNTMDDYKTDVTDSSGKNRGKGAIYLSKGMYAKNDSYATHLIYGSQWDLILNWVSDEVNILDSIAWGNYANSTGLAATNSGGSSMNNKTGRNDAWQVKNIYDLAGNVWEWTMESNDGQYRVNRGGSAYSNGTSSPVAWRNYSAPNAASSTVGFRPVMYIK